MEDLLRSVKTLRTQSHDTLAPGWQADIKPARSPGLANEDEDRGQSPTSAENRPATDPSELLQMLKSLPSIEHLITLLDQLLDHAGFAPGFTIHFPGPLQAQIINAIFEHIIEAFWVTLGPSEVDKLVRVLSSLAGLNALIARLKSVTSPRATEKTRGTLSTEIWLDVASRLCSVDDKIFAIWATIESLRPITQRDLVWAELVKVFTSGKIVSHYARLRVFLVDNSKHQVDWLSQGCLYARWLGRNACSFVRVSQTTDYARAAATLLAKALSLGYSSDLIDAFFAAFIDTLEQGVVDEKTLHTVFASIPIAYKIRFSTAVLRWMTEQSVEGDRTSDGSSNDAERVSYFAALIKSLTEDDTLLEHYHISTLTQPDLAASLSLTVRRAELAYLATRNAETQQRALEELLSTFGDRIFIAHAPILQQECIAQHILILAGIIHRTLPMAAFVIARSSAHMQGVSNRLDSSSERPRWLGMLVATAISSLVDKEGAKMNFDTQDMNTPEAMRYRGYTIVQDRVGQIRELKNLYVARCMKSQRSDHALEERKMPLLNGRPVYGPILPPGFKSPRSSQAKPGRIIGELNDDDDSKLQVPSSLRPYAKPDSDPEDSDEDATMVNRQKTRPPVYIRDLMSMLQDDKAPDRFQIAIRHAASLIRRKSDFGKEVKDHAEEILRMLCNLQDPFDTPQFEQLRLQAMVAVLLADVASLTPWLCRQSFAGEYSLAQRGLMLSALGLAGRELAGLTEAETESDVTHSAPNSEQNFPSKKLPSRLHAIYAPTPTSIPKSIDAASRSLERRLIQPLALQAADTATAQLNAVKVHKFSSRTSLQQRTVRKASPNSLAHVFSTTFYHPLVDRYRQDVASYSSGSLFVSVPFLLVTFLKTLALLLHAAGPATLHLREISSDFWALLSSLRTPAAGDQSVMEAVLFALLTLLEVNGENRQWLATEQARFLADTQEWAQMVFEKVSHGAKRGKMAVELDSGWGDEGRVRTLSAGILIKTQEIVQAHQEALFGRSI